MNLNNILLKLFKRYASKWLVLAFDLCVVICTFFFAYLIRFNFSLDFNFEYFLRQIPFVTAAALVSFLSVGSHKGVVRFTGIKDIFNNVVGVNILATILIVTTYISRKYDFDTVFDIPGSIIYIHLLLNIFFLAGCKFIIKSIYKSVIYETEINKRVLIYGAGNSGIITHDAITNDTNSHIEVAGFIDDNEHKIGKKINLLNVYSIAKITPDFVKKHTIDEVIISIQNISPKRLLEITNRLFELNLKVKIVPKVQDWIEGNLSVGQIKDINIEDLLGREPIKIINPALYDEYDNQVILVTGAAGSIGSELVRKLCNFNFKKLVLVDSAESPLYDLEQELVQKGIKNVELIVLDVRNRTRLDLVMETNKPNIVFHAAAYKHVPLMEQNPYEAVSVNILGTYNTAQLASKHGVNKFVLISTDKAVNPTNVMGASKRIAEMCGSCLKSTKTKFITTRFGNVLGSNGSVIPLFKKQIDLGGPLTVTHQDIIRYFMTIPEACQLVLEAAAMGMGQEIFVFDMGEPVKIFDLAKNMISLSGLHYPEDIDIKIVGLRPGEKIYEELLTKDENIKPTYHEKIMIAKTRDLVDDVELKIIELCKITPNAQNIYIVSKIKELVPEYTPNNSKYDVIN
ncbi:MAG: polysaccharide biosynthesis protein [Mangrovimonas sp.]|nr:polysaccharide biosynthesis protein [Mangrovimonas sp.]